MYGGNDRPVILGVEISNRSNFLNRYEKWFEKRGKRKKKRSETCSKKFEHRSRCLKRFHRHSSENFSRFKICTLQIFCALQGWPHQGRAHNGKNSLRAPDPLFKASKSEKSGCPSTCPQNLVAPPPRKRAQNEEKLYKPVENPQN